MKQRGMDENEGGRKRGRKKKVAGMEGWRGAVDEVISEKEKGVQGGKWKVGNGGGAKKWPLVSVYERDEIIQDKMI